MASIGKLLGKPLAWAASLGAAVLSAFLVWLMTHWFHPDAVLLGVIVAVAAKISGWLVSEYGPKPGFSPPPRG